MTGAFLCRRERWLGVQRPSLNKILKDLEKKGMIVLGYGRIEITDAKGLESLAR